MPKLENQPSLPEHIPIQLTIIFEEIEKALVCVNVKKSTGPDGLGNKRLCPYHCSAPHLNCQQINS